MTKLIFNGQIRTETDESIINNLQRKGWVIFTEPEIPEYDKLSEKILFNDKTNQYDIIELSTSEKGEITSKNLEEKQKKDIDNKIISGYKVLPEDFTLGLQDNDRNLFTQMISLIREALDLGLITNDTNQVITDINNQEVTLSTLRFRQIMVGYGMYYKSLWDQMA